MLFSQVLESPEGSLERTLVKIRDATCVAKAVVFGGYVSEVP
jgi:hypothetical protein